MSWQEGQVGQDPKSGRYFCRWYDAEGKRRYKGGFRIKSEARKYLRGQIDKADAGLIVQRDIVLADFSDIFLASHDVSPARLDNMRVMLDKAAAHFPGRPLRSLRTPEIKAWRMPMPPQTRWKATQVLSQVLAAAVEWGYLERNPASAKLVPNPQPKPRKQRPFDTWDELHALAAEIPPPFDVIPILATGTGLMPQEWSALEGHHVDRERRLLSVEQTWTQGAEGAVPYGKHEDKLFRTVPLRQVVLDALDTLDLVPGEPIFPGVRHRYMSVKDWREKMWVPAFEATGIERRRPYDMRHTYATWSLRAGVNIYTLVKRMGTSVKMIEKTYGHHAADATDYEAGLLDAYDSGQEGTEE